MSADPPLGLTPPRNAPEGEGAFEAAPDEVVAEIFDGELFTFARPARPHTRSEGDEAIPRGGDGRGDARHAQEEARSRTSINTGAAGNPQNVRRLT